MTNSTSSLPRVLSLSALGFCSNVLLAQSCDLDAMFVTDSFEPYVAAGTIINPIVSGDLDGDGDLDVVLDELESGQSARVYLNDGTGGLTYSPVPLQGLIVGPVFAVALADFNNDGMLDLAGVNGGGDGNDIVIYNGNGDATFGPQPSTSIPEFRPQTLYTADVDMDGFEDIVAFDIGREIVVYRNAGDGTFTDAQAYDPGGVVGGIRAGDLDGDGFPELVATNIDGVTTILRNQGDGTFMEQAVNFFPGAGGFPPDVRLGDLNNDGHLDIAYAIRLSTTGGLFYTFNDGAGNFQIPATRIENMQGELTSSLAILDADGDGDNDFLRLLRIGFDTPAGVLYRNDGTGVFSDRSGVIPQGITGPSPAVLANIGDYNGDGTLDLLVYQPSIFDFGIWFNSCFTPPVIDQQPVSRVADAGDTVDFSIALSGGGAPITYQWRRDGVDLVDDTVISGANSSTLVLNGVEAQDIAMYDCVVSNPQGTRISEAATLAIRGAGAPACTADLNGDGVLNFFDVSVFISAYNAGCP